MGSSNALSPLYRYANNMLVSYNVQCPEGRLPYLVFNELELRNKECFNRYVCRYTIALSKVICELVMNIE